MQGLLLNETLCTEWSCEVIKGYAASALMDRTLLRNMSCSKPLGRSWSKARSNRASRQIEQH